MKHLLISLVASLALGSAAQAQLGTVWHNPASTETGVPSTMRDPASPGANVSVTFYQGVWKGGGDNQTGGTVFYRFGGGVWQSSSLGFHSNSGSNQFWKATVSMPNSPGMLIEYYFAPAFDNRTSPTYLYSANQKSAAQPDAQGNPYSFALTVPAPTLTVNGVSTNYTKSNFYIDEINDTVFPTITVLFSPNVGNLTAVEIFTNLNNRDRADDDFNNDGVHDGIVPPSGNLLTTADTNAYFQAYAMEDLGSGQFRLVLPVQKTGAYRLTGRFKVTGNPNWIWVGDSGFRDHAIIVAPKIARDMRMYELHVTNLNATGPTFAQRGTFEDLHDPTKRANLDWLKNLGINWIWFQPFHPQGIEGRQTDPATNNPYDPGSPYSIRNFWEINPLYTRNYNGGLPDPINNTTNYTASMTAFQNFAMAADEKGVQLMLDFPFNHTSPDVVLGQKGLEIFGGAGNPGGWNGNDQIRNRVPGFFSTNGGEGSAAYSAPAGSSLGIAVAPDRDDFGKWSDVRDVFFGRYATLVTGYPGPDSSRATVRNEGDWMDWGSVGPVTQGVWRYFGDALPYWVVQSGHRGFNSTGVDGAPATRMALDAQGIDGLRKDFGQGLPPQCMEYIINRTHGVKWNFVFMTESLDGGEVTYRSSRHFPVLNENIVFPLQAATTTSGYRGVFTDRSSAYGNSLVLLNNTSHDEAPYADSWQALVRYATCSTNDGAPMIMYGQEIGAGQIVHVPNYQSGSWTMPQGAFDWYEQNFGKWIPNFKKWNSMQPQWNAWFANEVGTQFLFPVYSGIGKAREFSPALRSTNRWFLNKQSAQTTPNEEIFAVAKYSTPNAPAAQQDVVFAFVNLNRNLGRSDTFQVPPALADLAGIGSDRSYNVRNIAAYLGRNNEQPNRRTDWLPGWPRSGSAIRNDGIFVSLNPVPSSDAAWSTAPYEAQFLKLYDVTAPTATPGQPAGPNIYAYAIGSSVKFDWPDVAADAGGVVPHYQVTVTINGSPAGTFITAVSDHTVIANVGDLVSIKVRAVNPEATANAGPESSASASIKLLPGTADEDGDGQSNTAEETAGTDPFSSASVLQATAIAITGNDVNITIASVVGKTYQLETSTTLTAPSWSNVGSAQTAIGTSTVFTDPAGGGDPKRFYRARVVP
jgi:hypothetical protein